MTRFFTHWAQATQSVAKLARCPRSAVGAILIHPQRKEIIAEGYNGTPRGGPRLCGGEVCTRTERNIPSGTHSEIGCVHAEQNLHCNVAYRGISMRGMWVMVNRAPCGACAGLLKSSGIAKLFLTDADLNITEVSLEQLSA